MKILLATSFFPPSHTAGTEKRTLGYALSLQRLGHEVQVVCAGTWDQGNQYWNGYTDEIYQKIPVRRIHVNWMLAPDPNQFLYCNPIIEKYLGEWLKDWKPDIVHITSCVSLSASAIQAAKSQNIPVVLTLTDFWFICPQVNLLRGDESLCDGQTTDWDCLKCMLWDAKIYRVPRAFLPEKTFAPALRQASRLPVLSRLPGLRGMAFDMGHRKAYLSQMLQVADRVTAPSILLAEIVNSSVKSKQISVIYSGHDLSWLEHLKPGKRTGPLRIAYIGQIISLKGVHVLLSAFLAAKLGAQAELLIYGDTQKSPEYFEELQTLTQEEEATVQFMGAFAPEHLGQILSDIDVLVVPSLWHENNPRVIHEAFAAKIPVVASNVGGISEFVQQEINGLLFERGDVVDLSRQLRRLVYEPDLFEKLKSRVPTVKSIDEEILEFEAIYRQLVSHGEIILGEDVT